MIHRILSWDWKEQPDLDQLREALREVSGGTVHLHEVDTGSDQFAVVLTDREWSDDEVQLGYDRWFRGESS